MMDFRSDTVTKPTDGMRKYMANAEVGDDCYGDDPSVNALEQKVATLLGKEAGLFVPSGTMGNLIAMGLHCKRGEKVLIGDKSHIFVYEGGGVSYLMGVSFHTLPNQENGEIHVSDMEHAIYPDDPHFARIGCVTIENTQNKCGGKVLKKEYIDSVGAFCKKNGFPLHIDGARLINACVKLNMKPADLCEAADSISLCLSKGLGAPVGSVLVGTKKFIDEGRFLRKNLGGGMRQAGIIAAGCIYALDHHYELIKDDNDNAIMLAKLLTTIPNIDCNPDQVDSNLVMFTPVNIGDPNEIVTILKKDYNILIGSPFHGSIRLATHLQISKKNIEDFIDAMRTIMETLSVSA